MPPNDHKSYASTELGDCSTYHSASFNVRTAAAAIVGAKLSTSRTFFQISASRGETSSLPRFLGYTRVPHHECMLRIVLYPYQKGPKRTDQ
jgi:hypothetical protein